MKPKTLLFLILALCTCTSTMSFAQSRAEKRAKNRANQNVDRKIDQSVDKAFNKIEGLFKRKNKKKKKEEATKETSSQQQTGKTDQTDEEYQEEQAQDMVNNILKGMGGNDEPWEPFKNDYPMSFTADMTVTDKKGKVQKTNMQYVFDTWKMGIIYTMEDGEVMQMILDNQEGSMTTIMDDGKEKQGYKMKQRNIKIDEAQAEANETWEDQGISIKKTGRTKTTEGGYFAHEYEVTSEDGNGTMWATEDLPLDLLTAMQSSFARTSQMGKKKRMDNPQFKNYGVKGFPVETHFVNKDGKEKMDMIMKNFKTGDKIDRSPLDTKGVKIMSMGF